MLARKLIRESDKYHLIGIMDNNSARKERSFLGADIFGPEQIRRFICDRYCVAGRYIEQFMVQMNELGVADEKIIKFKRSEINAAPDEVLKREQKTRDLLVSVCSIFEQNSIPYWVDHSGLLAVERNQKLADMSDVEITIPSEFISSAYKLLRANSDCTNIMLQYVNRESEAFQCGEISLVNLFNEVQTDQLIEPAIVSVMSKIFHSDRVYWRHGDAELSNSAHYFNGFERVDYSGITLRVPLARRDYLRELYGADWAQPHPFWSGYH